jgi:hypothetical protein
LQQPLVGVFVSPPITLDLGSPKLRIVLRPGRVLRATVPETPVHEHRYARRSEDDVRLTSDTGYRPAVDSVPQARRVERFAHAKFDLRVPRLLPTHPTANIRCRFKRHHATHSVTEGWR